MDDDLGQLEAVLIALPDDRALPDVEELLAEAGLDASVLADERARKLLLDALSTRPHGQLDKVRAVNAEVELLVLEVRELTAALTAGRLDAERLRLVDERLAWARGRLAQLRAEL